ncbi:MAG: aldo/keto reductase family protein [Mycobacteriales bacterium]
MEYRSVGRSGLKVSEIAYGNWVTHGGQVGDAAAKACVRAAWESGVTFFDTADAYEKGAAETVLGTALKELAMDRSDVVIASKVYWPIGDNPNDRGLSRKHVLESIDKSLRRLQTDYLDIYQAHRHDRLVPVEETLRAFEDIVRSGKALYVGVSEWDAEQIAEALRIADEMNFTRIISNQPQYSMLYRVIEAEIEPLSRREGISQIVFSPLAQGVLTGKYLPGQAPPAQSRAAERGQWTKDLMHDDLLTAVQQLKPIADDLGISMASLALAWVLDNDNVAAAIIGATRPEQVLDNVQASGVTLTDDVRKRIDEVLTGFVKDDPRLTQSP